MGETSHIATFVYSHEAGFKLLRVVILNGTVWFVAADICRALELPGATRICRSLPNDERTIRMVSGLRSGFTTLVSEAGLRRLITREGCPAHNSLRNGSAAT